MSIKTNSHDFENSIKSRVSYIMYMYSRIDIEIDLSSDAIRRQ